MSQKYKKCLCKVNIIGTKKTRSCKGKVFIKLNNDNYCWSHAKKILGQSAIIIQSKFKGNRCRKKLKILYCNLPDEIKNVVLYYIRKDFYYFKYKKLCLSIIENKVNNIDTLLNRIPETYFNSLLIIENNKIRENFIKTLINIYNIFINNWDIIDFDYIQDSNLVKLYILARKSVWGITIWNGKGLENIFNSVYNFNYDLMYHLKNLLENFKMLWQNKFIYKIRNCYNASILLR